MLLTSKFKFYRLIQIWLQGKNRYKLPVTSTPEVSKSNRNLLTLSSTGTQTEDQAMDDIDYHTDSVIDRHYQVAEKRLAAVFDIEDIEACNDEDDEDIGFD